MKKKSIYNEVGYYIEKKLNIVYSIANLISFKNKYTKNIDEYYLHTRAKI